jgi:oligopeptide transport system permease protein
MRNLIPLDFADLGPAEFVWLLLAFAGLSLVWRERERRGGPALSWGFVLALIGAVRALAGEGMGAWDRWLGPIVVVPLAAAALIHLGALQPSLARRAGGAGRLAALWLGALVAWSLLARPFGRDPVAGGPEWLYLAFLGLVLCTFLQHGGSLPAALARPVVGRLRMWGLAAIGFMLLCFVTEPFGVGWVGALFHLFGVWLVHAVLEQGKEMRRYVFRRLVSAPIVLLLLMVLAFAIIRSAPGGPFDKDKRIPPEQVAAINARYGLDQPLHIQFKKHLIGVIWEGDLGRSTKQIGKKVNEIIAHHIQPSARLGLAALLLALLIGVTSGLIAGIRQNSIFDYASMAGAMLGLALPTFVVGPMLVLVFAMKIKIFNVSGWDLVNSPKDIVLPAFTLSLPFAARVARLTRAGMLEIVNQDYIRTARAKGLSEPVIVLRHTLKGTLLPVVSFLGPAVAIMLTGSLVVERIFGVPGLGSEFVNSALNRDYSLAMGLVILFGTLLITFNLIVDIAYGFLDPRIRHA